jgi:tRNA(Glu) U13 pseudouridine synthase TruD
MNDARYKTLPQWPDAYPASGASATLKCLNEDFRVNELPLHPPSGEGEHSEIRVRDAKKKGLYLSAVRSFVFNEVLALRIQQRLWGKVLPSDVMDEAGRPTGPLWGRGRVTSTDQAQALENGVAERHATLCGGMEYAGLDQERRALVASPADMS